ncbi:MULTISPECIES: hypothetical protein [unclassified Streptomyces]|uniref:hypothetical protein n=1 Tax=unclassified Streptomyces TaxID=2593676 RepID=UPI00225B9BE7|nr:MULTISPECIES: hypothetical protein [unclassified Streptomyces]MCX4525734.1 hypothetical protein [Streptomyces sp. NBC_01551]MCX4543696.1 hypothetical protein [Streptomyces sp. NBC_01565]
MTDGITWLAAPRSIAFGGYSVVMARGLTPQELVGRLTETVYGPEHTAVPVGDLTGADLLALLVDYEDIGLRYGRCGDWSYTVAYGGWMGEFGDGPPLSRGGVDICHLEFEEENGKPVPPQFAYTRDEVLLSAFNLHLDGSWGYDGVDGDPETASRVQAELTAAGLPADEGACDDADDREVHRTALGVLERHFGLSLPREEIVSGTLPAVLLEPA